MVSVRSFHKYRGRLSFTLRDLIDILKEQLPLTVKEQTKYRVTEIPTERTVRFYTANGLVDKPLFRESGKGQYGYRHLLQILAIKYLQSQYLPLVKIRSLLQGADNRHLELLIPAIAPPASAFYGLTRSDLRIVERSLRPPRSVAEPATAPPAPAPPALVTEVATRHDDTWHHIEVGPGIELHIHAATLTEENRERLRGALLRELGVLRGWFS